MCYGSYFYSSCFSMTEYRDMPNEWRTNEVWSRHEPLQGSRCVLVHRFGFFCHSSKDCCTLAIKLLSPLAFLRSNLLWPHSGQTVNQVCPSISTSDWGTTVLLQPHLGQLNVVGGMGIGIEGSLWLWVRSSLSRIKASLWWGLHTIRGLVWTRSLAQWAVADWPAPRGWVEAWSRVDRHSSPACDPARSALGECAG